MTLKPDCSRTLKSTMGRRYYHTGKWEVNRTAETKDEYGWSCCMNGERDSEGCVAVKVDKSRWILSSYT